MTPFQVISGLLILIFAGAIAAGFFFYSRRSNAPRIAGLGDWQCCTRFLFLNNSESGGRETTINQLTLSHHSLH